MRDLTIRLQNPEVNVEKEDKQHDPGQIVSRCRCHHLAKRELLMFFLTCNKQ